MTEELIAGAEVAPVLLHRLVSRQPIVGADDEVVGFRVLHRLIEEGDDTGWPMKGAITMDVVLEEEAFDIDALVGHRRLFLQPWPALMDGSLEIAQPLDRITLEVSLDECRSDRVIERCYQLRKAGCSIAVELTSWTDETAEILKLADIVEIDLSVVDADDVIDLAGRCKSHRVTLMAMGCASEAELTWAANVGFALFQGPAIERPERIGEPLAPSALARVQLATELLDERLDFRRVEEILDHEPALVVQVLHEASLGAAGGLRREVRSIRDALVVLGTTRLRQWAALAVFGRTVNSNRSDALTVALMRARMSEVLAVRQGIDYAYAFTAGMLSALDRMLGVPIGVIARRVEVDAELAAAAFHRRGIVGELVGYVADYQIGLETGDHSLPDVTDPDRAAALAFPWAMTHINAIERVSTIAAQQAIANADPRFVIGHR